MDAAAGDLIQVESETVGRPSRDGEILEVIEDQVGIRYHVHWNDGSESVFVPSGGNAKIIKSGEKG
jgi:hypothetical protein